MDLFASEMSVISFIQLYWLSQLSTLLVVINLLDCFAAISSAFSRIVSMTAAMLCSMLIHRV
jgi:hypothetical protein